MICLAWGLVVDLAGCSGAAAGSAHDASQLGGAPTETAGLRVALSESAKSVCVLDQGCAGAPKGTIEIKPLQPQIREVISAALVGAGFQLVSSEAERDMVADVEWRGTDTIALRLQDVHGRLLDQASFSRSLTRCQKLADLSWDTCWAANFEPMKAELARPFRHSAAIVALARKTKGVAEIDAESGLTPSTPRAATNGSAAALKPNDQLNALQLQDTVARYREELQRSCWQPALEARDPNTSTAARVSTSITVNPQGGVDKVTTTGDPLGYPRLAACIASQVAHWRFPPAKRSTTANIPFVFAGD